MGTHPIFESDFDCLTEMNITRVLAATAKQTTGPTRLQTKFNIWFTQFFGFRSHPDDHYMRYTFEQTKRTYPARNKPPGENERLHTVAYIYRDERRKVQPPLIVSNVADGTVREVTSSRPTPGFGTSWSLNAQEPVVRQHADFGMINHDKGYDEKEFFGNH